MPPSPYNVSLSAFISENSFPMTTEPHRLEVMVVILFISFFAVSFPGASQSISFLRIPHILFFIGKHFGTGVILSTAFCHLLQDAFESLQHPTVQERYHGIGKRTGLIILSSLLFIFLIEYLSTTYVEHLHSHPSVPPSPSIETPSSFLSRSPAPLKLTLPSTSASQDADSVQLPVETTPLIPATLHVAPNSTRKKRFSTYIPSAEYLNIINSPRLRRGITNLRCALSPTRRESRTRDVSAAREHTSVPSFGGATVESQDTASTDSEEASTISQDNVSIGRRRQVLGILVLQFGIMIHSLVIGLTLAITKGSDFASLVTAIVFHQLFEGLSLGIRIAALPPPKSFVTPLSTPRGFDGFSQAQRSWWRRLRNVHWLKPTLSIAFAITTPLGMVIGLLLFTQNDNGSSHKELAQMQLTQGLMSAISAGMLIYAATVEMIAGDFVFGELGSAHTHEPGHGHGHGHEHSHVHVHVHGHSLPLPSEVDSSADDSQKDSEENKLGVGKRGLAVVSLLAGVTAMGLVGLGD